MRAGTIVSDSPWMKSTGARSCGTFEIESNLWVIEPTSIPGRKE
jgi:hypothetical protein